MPCQDNKSVASSQQSIDTCRRSEQWCRQEDGEEFFIGLKSTINWEQTANNSVLQRPQAFVLVCSIRRQENNRPWGFSVPFEAQKTGRGSGQGALTDQSPIRHDRCFPAGQFRETHFYVSASPQLHLSASAGWGRLFFSPEKTKWEHWWEDKMMEDCVEVTLLAACFAACFLVFTAWNGFVLKSVHWIFYGKTR